MTIPVENYQKALGDTLVPTIGKIVHLYGSIRQKYEIQKVFSKMVNGTKVKHVRLYCASREHTMDLTMKTFKNRVREVWEPLASKRIPDPVVFRF